MAHDRHIRCWLVAALLLSAAVSVHDVQASPPRVVTAMKLRDATATLSVTAILDTRPAAPSSASNVRAAHVTAKPFESFVLSKALRDSIVDIALTQLGTPYVFGGTTPSGGFDCSGLVRYAMSQVHLTVPRLAVQQARVGASIERDQLQRGDLLAFGDSSGVTHIGIYVGAGWFVHASSVAGRVILSPLDRRPSRLIRPMRGARRLLAISNAYERRSGS